MRTLLAFFTLAVAALCTNAAPQARSFPDGMDTRMSSMQYAKQLPTPPFENGQFVKPPPPPFANGQYGRSPPPPFDDMRDHHDHQEDLHCSISRIIGWIVDAVAKLFGLNNDQGGFDLGKFWHLLTGNDPVTSRPVAWTSPPPPNFWGNTSAPETWIPQPYPYPSVEPIFNISFPSSPSMPASPPPFHKGLPSGTGMYASGNAGVMGFPSTGGMFPSGPKPMYDTVKMKSDVIKSQYAPMMAPERQAMPLPSVQAMSGKPMLGMQMPGMQGMQMPGMQGMPENMQMAAQAKAGAPPGKPLVAVGAATVAAKPGVPAKPEAPIAAKPVAPIAAKPVAPVVAKPVAPVVAKPAVMQTLRGR